MKIIVDHIYRQNIKKMYDAGWRVHIDDYLRSEDHGFRVLIMRASGCEMTKEFTTMGDAIRDFERITGYDAIQDEDQGGCPVFTFRCDEEEICVGGWECGRYLFTHWTARPRSVMERLEEVLEQQKETDDE